jgi:hypothetical protein
MDPNEILKKLRTWAGEGYDAGDAHYAAEDFTALDDWLRNGGFLPEAWDRRAQPTTKIPPAGENAHVDQMLHDVFVTALEGGINYWASVNSYHWTTNGELDGKDLTGFHAVIEDADPGTNDDFATPLTIDRNTIAEGFGRLTTGPVKFMPEPQRHMFLAMLHARLAGFDEYHIDIDYDAGDADNLVQVGLFGEVVYG